MRVKYLSQENNTVSIARVQTRIARSGGERTNHVATAPLTGKCKALPESCRARLGRWKVASIKPNLARKMLNVRH